MLRPFLVLCLLIVLSLQGPVVTEDETKIAACTPGQAWVDNYIKYQCFEDEGTKGIAVVGCAPKNDMTSEVLLPWQTHTTCNFKYVCEMDASHALYKVKTCMDRTGAVLKVGQSRTFDDGESVSCFEENGKIRLRITTKQGCIVGKAIYAEGHTWIEQTADTVKISSRSVTVSAGVSWQCKKDANGSFFSQAIACLSSENKYILPHAFGMVNGIVVKCTLTKESIWKLELANDAEISCKSNGKVVRNAFEWTTPDGKTGYVCHFGVVVKRSCIINGEEIPLHGTRYIDGSAYYCHAGDGVFAFGNLKGCGLPDGRMINFEKTYFDGEKIMKCSFNFTSYSTAIALTEQVGCLYNKEEISKNAMQLIDGHYIYCARKGEFYIARQLTAEEITIWLKMGEKSYSRLLDGVEGEGTGAQLNKPTTTTTTSTTTTSTSTTPKPSTATTTTPRTTTTPKPKSITTSAIPVVRPTPPLPDVQLPLTNCKDHMEPAVCKQLSTFCLSTATKVAEIREIVKKSLTADERDRVNGLLDHIREGGTEDDSISFGHLIRDSGTTNCSGCSSCANVAGNGGCRLRKRLVRELVRYTCPKTCGCPDSYSPQQYISFLSNLYSCTCKCC